MSEKITLHHRKRPRSSEEDESKSKKKLEDSDRIRDMNGVDSPKLKKAPRLSPALFQDNCEVLHSQIHELLKYAALGKRHNAAQPSWCHVHHQKRLRGVHVFVLQGLSQHHFYRYYLHLPCLRKWFRHRFVLPPPPSDFLAPVVGITNQAEINPDPANNPQGSIDWETVAHSTSKHNLAQHPVIVKYGNTKRGLTRYLLSEEEMRKNGYRLVGSPDSENYVLSGCSEEVTDNSPLFGLDCEMCLTDEGNELTRVSLVDPNGHCIMDELVKPDNPIRNYMTRFSGITKTLLHPVKTKLKDVQDKLKTLLPPNAVLVGHSLNNDLQALQMVHMNVIDTSLLFARKLERKFRLKFLTQAVLGREIQCEDVTGHDPAEDAKAALNLAQYFIGQGPEKVAQLNLEKIFRKRMNSPNGSLSSQEKIPVLKQNGLVHPPEELNNHSSLAESLDSTGKKIIYVTRKDAVRGAVPAKSFDNIFCSSEEEVLGRACSLAPTSAVSVIHFCPENVDQHCPDINEKVNTKFAEMRTVFAGPFRRGFCLKSVRKVFKSCGPIQSLSILADTYQPYIYVQYSVLEAARLALDLLNGSCIDGHCIKVQNPVTQRTLDAEDIIKAMEEDVENKDIIYVSGFKNSLTEEYLQEQFSHIKDIKAIFLPRNPQKGKHAKYCYLKFHSPQGAVSAAEYLQTHCELKSRKALTASHLHHWLQTIGSCDPPEHQPVQEICHKEEYLIDIIKNLDRKINQIYESLQENSLCVILFPGQNSDGKVHPGFGLMGIKELSN
ncbi:RNA exonuclease 5 [Discoglossus pictus]